MKLAHLPLRLTTGAYILNSGLSKTNLEGEAAEGVHGMASNAIPALKKIPPEQFARILSTGEIALGAALLIPFIPSAVVGAALVGFSAGLVQLYLKTPGMRQEGSLAQAGSPGVFRRVTPRRVNTLSVRSAGPRGSSARRQQTAARRQGCSASTPARSRARDHPSAGPRPSSRHPEDRRRAT
jgi:hypothetical protein